MHIRPMHVNECTFKHNRNRAGQVNKFREIIEKHFET